MTLKDVYNSLKVSLLTVALLVVSCQKDDSLDGGPASDEVEFTFTFPELAETPASRAVIGDDGRGTFEEGDRISLYVGDGPAGHHILTLRNGSWTPRLTREELGGGLVTLNACYPADEAAEDEVASRTFRLSADQSGEGYAASDILWVHKTVNMDNLSGGRIELPFTHGLHRLRLTLKSDSGELPSDLEVAVRGASGGSFSFFLGQVEADGSEAVWITPKAVKGETGSFRAVLVPQPLKELQTGDGWIRITSGGKTAYYRAPDKIGSSANLEPGKENLVTLHLKTDGGVEPEPDPVPGDWANSKHWLYGIGADTPFFPDNIEDAKEYFVGSPEKFPDGEWFRIPNTEVQYLNYNSSYGWYDCDKDNPEERGTYEGYKDWYMCWAATASNLLHWWMYHNRAYIEAYDQRYGTDLYPEYPRPSMKFSDTEGSKLFDFFRDIFLNIGNWDAAAVNWFVRGEPINLRPDTNGPYYDFYHSFGGYFRQVFDGQTLARTEKSLTKESFTRIIKEAISKKQALGFVRAGIRGDSYGQTGHAMTLWGAEFDAEGYVSAIYYVDNNDHYTYDDSSDGSGRFQHHRCLRQVIVYHPESVWEVHFGTGGYNAVNSLTTVDLGWDIWQEAFPEVQPEDE